MSAGYAGDASCREPFGSSTHMRSRQLLASHTIPRAQYSMSMPVTTSRIDFIDVQRLSRCSSAHWPSIYPSPDRHFEAMASASGKESFALYWDGRAWHESKSSPGFNLFSCLMTPSMTRSNERQRRLVKMWTFSATGCTNHLRYGVSVQVVPFDRG